MIENNLQDVESSADIKTKPVVPRYFSGIRSKLIRKWVPENRLQTLDLLVATLHQVGCSRKTIEALCIQGGFVDLEELINANLTLKTLYEVGVEYSQRVLLVSSLKKFKEDRRRLRTAPKSERVTIEFFMERIREMVHTARNRTESCAN